MLDRIEVFKAGTHRAIDGAVHAFSEADLAAMAAAYDPALQRGPIVLGHPKTDDPAWGWIKGLAAEGGVLFAETEKLDPAFAEGVEAGRYRYVSPAFYAPADVRNPKPGSWYLRHLGFLGAQPPAVKGLTPAFSEAPEADLVAFASAEPRILRDLFRGLRDWMIETQSLELADKLLPAWYVDAILVEDAVQTVSPAYAEETADPPPAADPQPITDPAVLQRAAELDAREAEIAGRELAFAESERVRVRGEDAAFLDTLVSAGRLPPAQKDRVAAIMARLGGDAGVAFAEADADPRAELRDLLAGLGTTIAFAEVSGGGLDVHTDPAQLATRAGVLVDEAAARGERLSYADAVSRAQAA